MQQLLDFLPLLAFFIAFKAADIYVATLVLIIASAIQIVCDKIFFGSFKKTHIIVFVILVCFGVLTIVFRDPVFLKWKVTVVELMMAVAFFVSQYLKRPLVGLAFKSMHLPMDVLCRVNLSWGIFSIIIALLNIAVAFGLPEIMEDQERALEIWVDFKVWGIMLLSIILVIINCKMLYPYMQKNDGEQDSTDVRSKLMVEKHEEEDKISRRL